MYAKIGKDGKVVKFPYTLADMRNDLPGFCLPDPLDEAFLKQISVVAVAPAPPPAFDQLLEGLADATPVQLADGTWQQQWQIVQRYATEADRAAVVQAELARLQADYSDRIDAAVATACARPQRFTTEYLRREQQARSYVALHDAVPKVEPAVPPLIASFAASAGLPAYAAACLTISQANALYAALDQLANLRMRKYEVKRATTIAAARTAFDAIMADIAAVAIP